MSSGSISKEQIFNLAAEIRDPQQRRQLLDQLCGSDTALRAEMEELLSQDAKLEGFLEPPIKDRTGSPDDTYSGIAGSALIGSSVGSYQIEEIIGRGGMGTVYLAQQSHPIKRSVALKVIRNGLDSRNVLARFAAERQALALMNHPHIARIADVGTTDRGQPWFAMELVQGPPITKYCDENRLSIEDRLRLFVDVCAGVQHAHQKGIIHRDLKPSNILITEVDGRPVPKVIDFGLAKALENSHQLTDESLHTQIGQIVGTLRYMSPEQATLDLVDIDTRTDIYSLGVLLYELLTGSTPLDDATLNRNSVLDVLEMIRGDDPVKPSRRLSANGDRAEEITRQRRTDRQSLKRILIGDLDWVVTKTLEKDRDRRYETTNALASDIRRFLDNEPVKARPPSTGYRLRKFVRKNRSPLAVSLLLLIAGLTSFFLWQQLSIRAREVQTAQMLRDGETYLARIAEGRELLAQRTTPWREKTLNLFAEAASLPLTSRDDNQLRTLTATAAVQPDLQPVATILEGTWCDCLAFDPAGQYLALGQNKDDTGFAVWIYRTNNWDAEPHRIWIDCAAETALRMSQNHAKPEDGARAIAFSPDGRQLAVGTRHGRFHVFSWVNGTSSHLYTLDPHPGVEVERIEYARDGNTIFVFSMGHRLCVIRNGKLEMPGPLAELEVEDIAVSPTEDAIFVISVQSPGRERLVQRYEFSRLDQPTWQQSTGNIGYAGHLSISNDGRYLAIEMFEKSKIEVLETQCAGIIRCRVGLQEPLDKERQQLSLPRFSHGDAYLVTTSYDMDVRLWDLAHGLDVAAHVVAQRGGRPRVASSPTQPLIAVTEHLKTTIFQIKGTDICHVAGHSAAPILDISPNSEGNRIAMVGSRNGFKGQQQDVLTYGIFDPRQTRPTFHYLLHEPGPKIEFPKQAFITFTPDGQHLISKNYQNQPVLIPTAGFGLDELDRWRCGDHNWIQPGKGQISSKTALECVADRSGKFDSLLPVLPDDRQQFQLECGLLDDNIQCAEKYWHAFAILRLQTPGGRPEDRPSAVVVDGKSRNVTSLQIPIGTSENGWFAVWLGEHRPFHPRFDVPLQVRFQFDRPVRKILVAGILLSDDPMERLTRKKSRSNSRYGPVSRLTSHGGSHTVWSVLDSDHLQIIDYDDLSPRPIWTNRSISSELRLGTLEPLLSTDQWVVCGTIAGEIFVFDPESGELINSAIPKQTKIRRLCQLGHSDRCVAAMLDGSFQVLDLPSLNVVQSEKHHRLSIEDICYHPARDWLLAGSEDGTISVWQTVGGRFEHYFSIDLKRGPIRRLLYLEPSNQLAVLIDGETAIRLIDLDRLCQYLERLDSGLVVNADAP